MSNNPIFRSTTGSLHELASLSNPTVSIKIPFGIQSNSITGNYSRMDAETFSFNLTEMRDPIRDVCLRFSDDRKEYTAEELSSVVPYKFKNEGESK
jgi:hypothetical protein